MSEEYWRSNDRCAAILGAHRVAAGDRRCKVAIRCVIPQLRREGLSTGLISSMSLRTLLENSSVAVRCRGYGDEEVRSPAGVTCRDVDRQEKGAEGLAASGSGGRNHPWADWQAWSSLEPAAHQAIAPGACRGWRRHLLAHIRAQKEPSFSPLGTASNTADHEGSPGGSRSLASHRGTLRRGGKMQISRTRRETPDMVRGETTFRSRGRGRRAGRAHGQEKALRAGRPAGRAGHGPRRRWRARLSGSGVGQNSLRPLLRGHEAPRLDVPKSTGSVPLQSG